MDSIQVLICCETELEEARGTVAALEADGYVVTAVNGREEARRLLDEIKPSLLLLDLVLPESDEAGWELLGEIGAQAERPAVIVVSSKLNRVSDRVRALDMGADDFISTRKFELEELKARIRAVLRRTRTVSSASGIEIDDARKEVIVEGRRITLSPREFYLLKLLAAKPGHVFSSREILNALWSESAYASDQDVQKYIYLLRKKIEADPKRPVFIMTVRGFGYRLAT